MPSMSRPRDELRRMLEQTLIPPPGVCELAPDSISRTTERLAALHGDASERYHLASKLTVTDLERLADTDSAAFIRTWYLETAREGSAALEEQGSSRVLPVDALWAPLAQCLRPFSVPTPTAAMLYGADVIVSHEGGLWKIAPGTGRLLFEGTFDTEHAQRVAGACRGWVSDWAPEATTFVFCVGPFTRCAYLLGDRGYRHALLTAGRVLGHITSAWECLEDPRPPFATFEEFVDREVDGVLRNDGVERGAVSVTAFVAPQMGADKETMYDG